MCLSTSTPLEPLCSSHVKIVVLYRPTQTQFSSLPITYSVGFESRTLTDILFWTLRTRQNWVDAICHVCIFICVLKWFQLQTV